MAKETLKDRLQRETLEMVVEQVDEITAQLERLDRQDQVIGKLSQQVDVIDLTVANLRSTLEQANSSIADLRAINQTTREEFIALKARLEAQQAPQGGSVHIHGDVGGDVGGTIDKSNQEVGGNVVTNRMGCWFAAMIVIQIVFLCLILWWFWDV